MGLEHVRAGHWRGDVEHLVLDDRGGRVRLVQILEDSLSGVWSHLEFVQSCTIKSCQELRVKTYLDKVRSQRDIDVPLLDDFPEPVRVLLDAEQDREGGVVAHVGLGPLALLQKQHRPIKSEP